MLSFICPFHECPICMERKWLIKFCNEHRFCKKCSSEWAKLNNFCPICRNRCVNKSLFTYSYELLNIDRTRFQEFLEDYCFTLWHNERCINKKHHFIIRKKEHSVIMYCQDCHVEEEVVCFLTP